MPETSVEQGLLKRVLLDPATGLPNKMYLELIRNWEQSLAERQGMRVLFVALTLRGGTEHDRRTLALHLCESVRKSDFIASEGPERFYLLLAMREPEDLDAVRKRIDDVTRTVNDRYSTEWPVSVELEVAEPDAEDACAEHQ